MNIEENFTDPNRSSISKLYHLLETFQEKQQFCSQLSAIIEQDEVKIDLESKRLLQLRSKVNELKYLRHDLRQVINMT